MIRILIDSSADYTADEAKKMLTDAGYKVIDKNLEVVQKIAFLLKSNFLYINNNINNNMFVSICIFVEYLYYLYFYL